MLGTDSTNTLQLKLAVLLKDKSNQAAYWRESQNKEKVRGEWRVCMGWRVLSANKLWIISRPLPHLSHVFAWLL